MADGNALAKGTLTLVQKLLLQAKEEFQQKNFEGALKYCTAIIESLQPCVDDLHKKASGPSPCKSKKSPPKVRSNQYTRIVTRSESSCNSSEWDPVGILSIGELTELITNPPGQTCSESKFAKAFAIGGEEFARSVFKIIKGTSVTSLESLARWAVIQLLENYCHNILVSRNTPEYDKGPDPVLLCPVYDTNELRFDDNAMYSTTTMLSNLIRKFMEDLDVCHSVQASLLASFLRANDCSVLVTFHTDLSLKQNFLTVNACKRNWLNLKHVESLMIQCEQQEDPVLLYALMHLKRSYIYFVLNQPANCAQDSSTLLKLPVVLANDVKVTANLLKARSLYKAGHVAKKAAMLEDKESLTWKRQLEYLRFYRSAALSFAYALELMNESEFSSEMHECNIEMIICLQEVLAAQRSDCQLKTCCLCWKNCNLQNSHILPKFILQMLGDDGNILVGNELKGSKQVHYPMLCHDCEQQFCNLGETHFKKLFLDKVRSKPNKRLEISHGDWFYYFIASLIWRVYLHFKYKVNFSEVLRHLPFFAMRKFLLTGDIKHLTTDCFIYLFVDKDVFDEDLCKMSTYKSFARRGGGCTFIFDESLYICYFSNFYFVFPIGDIQNAFLLQGSVKRVKFGEGIFVVEKDLQRSMPVFLERFICKMIAPEYDTALSSISHQAHDRICRSLCKKENDSVSGTTLIPKVIRCLPTDMSVSLNSRSEFNIELQGAFKVKCPPIDCTLAEEPDKRFTLYICEDSKHNLLALYRVYSHIMISDHLYAFQLSLSSTGEVEGFCPYKGIRNKQYFDILLQNNPTLLEFLKSVASLMLLSEVPGMDVNFFPAGVGELCQLQQDGSILFPQTFAIGNPVKFKNMTLWLCKLPDLDRVAILRLFCRIAYDERPSYDYLLALRIHSANGNVKSIEPLCPPLEQQKSEVHQEIQCYLSKYQSVCIEAVELLQDTVFLNHRVISCLPKGMYSITDFFPITQATSTDSLEILANLGSVDNLDLKFCSWLCSHTMSSQQCSLIVLEKWKVSDLSFVIAFTPVSSETDPLQCRIFSLSTLSDAPYTSIFMKTIKDYCSDDFDSITRNIVLAVQGILKVNSRIRAIFSKKYDPFVKQKAHPSKSDMILDVSLDPILCLPSGCNVVTDKNENETLQLSPDYSLLCTPLKTPLYTVWLCLFKDVHELIVVKTGTGIENVCSSVIVSLDFACASHMQTSESAGHFKFYPFSQLNASEVDFVEEDFLASETFQSNDPQFSVLMACVQILLSQLYQCHDLQTFLPPEFQIDIAPSGEIQLLYPHPFIAGPIYQETPSIEITCWLFGEGLGMVKVVSKLTKCKYITALSFAYSGSAVSELELLDLSPSMQFLAQSHLYLEDCASYFVTAMLKTLCDEFTMRELPYKI